jgi:hypothetical protein
MHSEDWDIVVPLFKKLQEDWKKIGHVPRSQTNKVWDDFRKLVTLFSIILEQKTMLKQTTGKKITNKNVHF